MVYERRGLINCSKGGGKKTESSDKRCRRGWGRNLSRSFRNDPVVTSFRSQGQLTVARSVNQPTQWQFYPRLRSNEYRWSKRRARKIVKRWRWPWFSNHGCGCCWTNNREWETTVFHELFDSRRRRVDGAPRLQGTFMHPESSFPSLLKRRMPLDAVSVRRTPTRERKLTYGHEFLRTPADPTTPALPALW